MRSTGLPHVIVTLHGQRKINLMTINFERRFFTNSRNFYEKRSKLNDRAFEKKCPAAIFVLKTFQNVCKERQKFTTFFGFVIEQNIANIKEDEAVSIISYLFDGFLIILALICMSVWLESWRLQTSVILNQL